MKAGKLRTTSIVSLAALGLLVAGCSLVSVPSKAAPKSVRMTVDAPPGVSVQLLTSTEFYATTNQTDTGPQLQVSFVTSDTSWLAAPVDKTYDISNTGEFIAYLLAADSSGVPVHMKVWVDNALKYDHTEVYPGITLTFLYQYQ